MKKTLIGLALGTLLAATPAMADYECKGTGPTIYQENIAEDCFRTIEDYDGDGKGDARVTYIFDRGCIREVRRTTPPANETLEEAFIKDVLAIGEYLKSLERKHDI
ncbi:MAG: hypothetical protein ABIB43_01730 [archaeon]